jgi:general secretion pathway protein D
LDPSVSGNVTVLSSEPLDEEGVWALFQSILRSRGFAAVESGVIWQIVPEAEARTIGGADPMDAQAGAQGPQDVVTEILYLSRLPSTEAVRVLRPLVADAGYMEALVDPNAILVTDTRANVDRIIEIATAFDTESSDEEEIIRFNYADATAVGSAIVELLGTSGTGARLSVNASANLLLVRGSRSDIDEIRELARSLDVAPRTLPEENVITSIFRLQYGDATVVTEILRGTLGQAANLAGIDSGAVVSTLPSEVALDPVTGELLAVPQTDASQFGAAPRQEVALTVQASVETNSVIVRGTQAQVEEVAGLINALDVRRPQVMIEAAIVEVSGDVAERLGIQLGFGGAVVPGNFAATSFGNGGVSLSGVLAAIGAPSSVALSTGLSVGFGGNDFSILIQALSQSSQARLLSTPSVTTLDNAPATIVVGQNVPFRTGSIDADGDGADAFTTIERRDVGITMNVVPRITAGGVVQLDIQQEVSSLVTTTVEGAADLITNTRVINTTVLADDGGTIVLGGLISDERVSTEARVPGLSEVPLIGRLFRSQAGGDTRRTLFVFLRPTILRDAEDVAAAAEARYDRLTHAEVAPLPDDILGDNATRRLPLEIQGLY